MNILQSVRVRGEVWRVIDLRAYDDCQLVTLVNGQSIRQVLTPFDDVEPVTVTGRWRRAGRQRWRRACRAILSADAPPGTLRAACQASMELLPHQLAPALAVIRGRGSRILIADDVGLGKTVQAGLIVAELMARDAAPRVLVVVPSGLRDQWADELRGRFGIDAVVADARTLRQTAANLPAGVNPWTTLPIVIASLDYVKRPEVRPAVESIVWDVVVVDEAHGAAGDSDRQAAVAAITARAAYVILLTATPHNGDERAFASLCSLGRLSGPPAEPLLVFRRTRQLIGAGHGRRVRTLRVRPSPLERRVHDLLARYTRAVRDEHGDRALALSVLEKRAYSSPWALAQSVARRLFALESMASDSHAQLTLPLAAGDGESNPEDEPPEWPADLALADRARERALLDRLHTVAQAASARGDSKHRALNRLLARIREPAIVFTEYRDTAQHLARTLARRSLQIHGGMDRDARQNAIDAFHRQPDALLIATDAAGQGLNLHRASRLVINVELPWNPMRLEQRIGRVDRIGQRRTVHAVHLVARSTGEARILNRLRERVATARHMLDVPDPLATPAPDGDSPVDAGAELRIDSTIDPDAVAESKRVSAHRAWHVGPTPAARRSEAACRDEGPLVVRARAQLRRALGDGVLVIARFVTPNTDGVALESQCFGVRMSRPIEWPDVLAPGWIRALPAGTRERWRTAASAATHAFWSQRLERERAIANATAAAPRALFQPALFDRRADREAAADAAAARDREHDARERLAMLVRRSHVGAPRVDILLIADPR